jgi:transposase
LPHISAGTVLTRRAGWEACRQVGANARPVAGLARELGVCWSTVMKAVIEHGTPLVEDLDRVCAVINLGVAATSFLKANRHHPTRYVTGLVDLDRRMVIDMVEGNAAADLRQWCSEQEPSWLAGIATVATDLAESYAGLWPHLMPAERVADPFHVMRVANRCVDKVRRRVQNETLGHRGRKPDALYRIRKLLLTGTERREIVKTCGSDFPSITRRLPDPAGWVARSSPPCRTWRRLEPARRGGER